MKKLDGILLHPEPGDETVEGIPYLPREKALALAREILRLYGECEPAKLRWTGSGGYYWHLFDGDGILCDRTLRPKDDRPIDPPTPCRRCVRSAPAGLIPFHPEFSP